jgi:hypothetical protein
MNRASVLAAAALLAALPALSALTARADGIMVPSRADWKTERERALINEVDQKAAVLFRPDLQRETLLISPSYRGLARDFAWVVPVPARPRFSIVQGAPFHELATLTYPRGLDQERGRAPAAAVGAAMKSSVRVLERRTVGAYDVTVLAADAPNALRDWLDRNDYYLPPAVVGPLSAYVRERWTFVACRIKNPDNARTGLLTGTLAPLKLTFPTSRPVYPMRLSAANPEPFNVLVYVLTPDPERGLMGAFRRPTSSGLTLAAGPRGRGAGSVTARRATYTPGPAMAQDFPTLAGLLGDRITGVYVERRTIAPADCTADYAWAVR